MNETTDNATVERVQGLLAIIDSDLSACLLDNDVTDTDLRAALEDADAAVMMLGCALNGASDLYGGEPASHIVERWTHIAQAKVQLAKAMLSAREGS